MYFAERTPKRHIISDGKDIPPAVIQTGAHVHDSQQAIPLINAIPAIKIPGGGRRKPSELYADKAYDADAKIRKPLRGRRIILGIAKRGTLSDSGDKDPSSRVFSHGYSSKGGRESALKNAMTCIRRSSPSGASWFAGIS